MWKQKSFRRIVLSLVIVVFLIGLVCIILPASVSRSRHHRIVAALDLARTIRIEEFEDESVVTRHELNAMQREALLHIIPEIIPKGLGMSFRLCFVPHHRIIATAPDGVEFTITLCFLCDMAQHTNSQLYDMPSSGSESLRQLFGRIGVKLTDRNH